MYKVTTYENGIKAVASTYQTIEEAASQISKLHELFKGAGLIQGKHYDIELSEV